MFGRKKKEDAYFVELCADQDPDLVSRIRDALEKDGCWRKSEEWRISTWTDMSVTRIEDESGRQRFNVCVSCDHEFACSAPTIERAAQWVWIYQKLIMRLFYQLGWPSWISLTEHSDVGDIHK